jgi:hypothetical protein
MSKPYYPEGRGPIDWRNSMLNPPTKKVRWQDLILGNKYILNSGFIRVGLFTNTGKKIMKLEKKPHVFKKYYPVAGGVIYLCFERKGGEDFCIRTDNMRSNFTFTQINENNAANKIRHFMMSRKVYKNAYKPPSGFYYKHALSRWPSSTRKNNSQNIENAEIENNKNNKNNNNKNNNKNNKNNK